MLSKQEFVSFFKQISAKITDYELSELFKFMADRKENKENEEKQEDSV